MIHPVITEQTRCTAYNCDEPKWKHTDKLLPHAFTPPAPTPEEHERVPAIAITTWWCHACGKENDVWGEGALGNWMECGRCQAQSWLDIDLYLADPERPTPA